MLSKSEETFKIEYSDNDSDKSVEMFEKKVKEEA